LETKRIPSGPECLDQRQPAFSHNGKYLAYWCFRSEDEFSLNSLALPDGQPKVLSHFAGSINGLTWSADDKKLIYARTTVEPFGLGEVTVANGSLRQLAFAGNAELPTVSPKGDKLAFTSFSVSAKSNIWRRDLLHPEAPAVELVPSTRAQDNARYSPDGKHIAFESHRSGVVTGVWISNEDGSNLVQISNPHDERCSPQWSPDGYRLAFDSLPRDRSEIYVADVAERVPRKLVTNISDVIRPYWSRDGKWIYFRSSEVGRAGLYRCPASGGDAVPLSKDIDAYEANESSDGRTVYFTSRGVLKRVAVPVHPGTESAVEGLPSTLHWTVSAGGIYFVPDDAARSVRYFDFGSKQIRPLFEVDKDFGAGLSVSPDGRWMLYSQGGDVNSDIMLAEHFH
jgi:Tol biopolymer transport system component